MIKNVDKLMSRPKFESVIQIPQELHEILTKPSNSEYENIGKIYQRKNKVRYCSHEGYCGCNRQQDLSNRFRGHEQWMCYLYKEGGEK